MAPVSERIDYRVIRPATRLSLHPAPIFRRMRARHDATVAAAVSSVVSAMP